MKKKGVYKLNSSVRGIVPMSAAEGFIEKITFKWSLEGCVETILKEEGIRKEWSLL